MNFNPKVDDFISKQADFAKPILEHFRQIVHENCPDVEEKMKWSMPFFDYKGEMMCHMAAFKHHCAFGFWKAKLMKDAILLENAQGEHSMGHLGKITSLADLPTDSILAGYIKEAMVLNDLGLKIAKPKSERDKEIEVPSDFLEKIEENEEAMLFFEKASYSFKKEYIMWVNESKTDATRQKRMQQAVEWIAEGKGRNWKYESR